MNEVRPIRADEAETFLHLLCTVFDLDFDRAKSVFFGEPYFDLNRKWALFDSGRMVSVLTTTPLEFGWGKAIGIAGVATLEDERRVGHAAHLLSEVLRIYHERGIDGSMLFARALGLYSRVGFELVDEVIRAEVGVGEENDELGPLPLEPVRRHYEQWASSTPHRLRRDPQRWNYWKWHYRVCFAHRDGYIASEPGVLREAVFNTPGSPPPLPKGTDWFGLRKVADGLDLSLGPATPELLVMTRGFPGQPEMFMTDQF